MPILDLEARKTSSGVLQTRHVILAEAVSPWNLACDWGIPRSIELIATQELGRCIGMVNSWRAMASGGLEDAIVAALRQLLR
jgi:hypothetical protein